MAMILALVRPRRLTDKSRIIDWPYCCSSSLSTLSKTFSILRAVSSVACSEEARFISSDIRGKSCGILGFGTNLTIPPAKSPALTIKIHKKPIITV